jgi:hypothetical protein
MAMVPIGAHLPKPALSGSPNCEPKKCRPSHAAEAATILVGFFRRADCENVDAFMRAAELTFCEYPRSVVDRVCHPVHGLPAKLKWFPSVAEIRAACDYEDGPRRREMERQQRFHQTQRLLAPVERDPEEVRERATARAKAMVAEIRGEQQAEQTKANAEQRLVELYEHRNDPTPVSRELQSRFARINAERDGAPK